MNLLPLDIIHHIIKYDGRIKYRNGKYINQIMHDDYRYKMLQSIPKIKSCYQDPLYMTISFNKQYRFEKFETTWNNENPWIFSYITYEESIYCFKKQNICYKFTILKNRSSFIELVLQKLYEFITFQ